MKRICSLLYVTVSSCYFFACGSHTGNTSSAANDTASDKQVIINPTNNVPAKRATVKEEAVAEYKEKTDDPLNDFYFSVKLYETPVTFYYVIKMQFEEVRGEDTLKLPNFGKPPQPVLQKGKEKYSCIIGFMDNDNQFREYKLVHMKGNKLSITALKHYAVATYQE